MDIWVQCFFFEGVKLYVCLFDKVDKVDMSLQMCLQYGVGTQIRTPNIQKFVIVFPMKQNM